LAPSRASTSSGASSIPEKNPDYDVEMYHHPASNTNMAYSGEVGEVNSSMTKVPQYVNMFNCDTKM